MRVGIDSGPLTGGHSVRGIGFYTKNLVEALQKDEHKNLSLEVIDFSNASELELKNFDVLHYPYFDLFYPTLRVIDGVKTVVTIHDVIPLIYPNIYKAGIKGRINLFKQKQAMAKVDIVITDSETSKKDIVRLLNYPANRIKVIYLAANKIYKKIDSKFELEKVKKYYKLDNNFVLYVGDVNYNKNVAILAQACINLKIQLVIVGKHATQIEEILSSNNRGMRDFYRKILKKKHPEVLHLETLNELFKSKYIKRLGFVNDQDLVAIYNLAGVYAMPSIYEGFGFTPLEAMASGCPVIINKSQTLVEVSGDGAMIVNFKKNGELENALESVISNSKLRNSLINKGMRQIKKYSWKKTALETLELYKSVNE